MVKMDRQTKFLRVKDLIEELKKYKEFEIEKSSIDDIILKY